MKKFLENETTIVFNDSDQVVKLDNHRYYKYVSGRGFKGVDFLVLTQQTLYLIELKDFEKSDSPISKEKLAQVFYQKCEDTCRLIEIIHKVLLRKWNVKLFYQKFNIPFLISKEDRLWLTISDRYTQGQVILIGNFDNI